MATLAVEKIISEYKRLYIDFSNFESALKTQLEKLITNDIKLGLPLQSRVKTIDSLVEKYETKKFNIKKSILELQDLIGFRVVLIFKRDIDKIISLINQNFDVVKFYDTADKLENNQFGYSSKHYVIKIKASWAELPTLRGFEKYTAEIQIRTLSQHNWAEASNVLQYKDVSNVPKEIVRTISRVSAFLETVDLELERTLQEKEKYARGLAKNIDNDLKLNVDVLSKILSEKMPNNIKKNKEGYSYLLHELVYFNISTVNELKHKIETNIRFENEKIYFFDVDLNKWMSEEKVPKTDTAIISAMLSWIDFTKYLLME